MREESAIHGRSVSASESQIAIHGIGETVDHSAQKPILPPSETDSKPKPASSLRRWLLRGAACGLIVLSIAAGLLWTAHSSLNYQPDFYKAALVEQKPAAVRKQLAKEFVQTTLHLAQSVEREPEWNFDFTQEQVNSWLAEELPRQFGKLIPPEVTEPRVGFVGNEVEFAAQYRYKGVSTVIHGRLRPWVAEERVIAFELQSLKAGLVPVPLDKSLEEVTRDLTQRGVRVEWKQGAQGDVLYLHLDRHVDADVRITEVSISQGTLRIAGQKVR